MVLDVGHMSERVDEAHRAVEILELEFAPQDRGLLGEDPAGSKVAEQFLRVGLAERRHTAVARLTALCREIAHMACFCAGVSILLRANFLAT